MTISVNLRRDPPKGKNGFSTSNGFTLVELMIALAVLAIITSIALPSYRSLIEKRQVTSGAEQIGAFLSSAQLESVKRNQYVAVDYTSFTGGWCLGMRAGDATSTSCDCTITDTANASACVLDGELRVFNSSSLTYPGVVDSAAVGGVDTVMVYDPVRGLILNAESATIKLTSDNDLYALNVEVSVTGRVKLCSDKTANKDVPGYKECDS